MSEDKDWLDGKQLRRWILERFPDFQPGYISKSFERRWNDWGRGSSVFYTSADAVLTRLGCHLHELPDDIWSDRPQRRVYRGGRKSMASDETKEAARKAVCDGYTRREVAARFGVHERTITSWVAEGKNG